MTKIYGASDDLVEFNGDVQGEVGCYGTNKKEHGVLVVCSDGTVIEVKYGKASLYVWGILVIREGNLFDRLETCSHPDADPYSDVDVAKSRLEGCDVFYLIS